MRYLLIICSTCDRGRYSQATDISYQYILAVFVQLAARLSYERLRNCRENG